jgi:carbon-monoxide dehydrogenase medium subunit
VKSAPFRYERPGTLDDALELLGDPDAKAIAGGQSLVPMMAMRLARPRVLVDLRDVAGLGAVEQRDGELETGAMVRQRALERRAELAGELPLVAAAIPHIGHREVRNRGTIGGSIAHADPAAELGLVAATLGATVVAHGSEGRREIAADQFVRGPFQTALRSDELLTSVRWPTVRAGDGFAFAEIARRHGDFALCGVAVQLSAGGGTATARVGLMGVGPAPLVRELKLTGDDDLAQLADGLAGELEPSGDMHASAEYRRRLARVLVERCLRSARERAS